MDTGKTMGHLRQYLILTIVVVIAFAIIGCGVFGKMIGSQRATPESLRAASETEVFLTSTYEKEVRKAIANFESRWSSLDAHENPRIQSEIAAGSFLDFFGYARKGTALYDEPFWLVVKSVEVEDVRVLEYSPERFKAIACVIEQTDETNTEGELIKSLPPQEKRGVYVFIREDNTWKLSGYFDVTHQKQSLRDWGYASDWLKEAVGNLPDWEPCKK